MLSTLLDLLGVACLCGGAFLLAGVWLALVVFGLAVLFASRQRVAA